MLKPGASVSSDRVMFNFAPNPFAALESYAQAIGDVHKVRLNPPINGWCSWFSFFGAISEAEVLRQAEFAARHLKPFGFEYMQVDDGFYRAFGDWEGNDRFPHGMKWLAEQIRSLGLKPGIWLAPYVIAEGTEIHRNHPDWLIHRVDGKLKQIGPGLVEGSKEAEQQSPKLYALDITNPAAADWLRKLFHTVANDWGYDFIKIDFVEWTLLAAERYYDPTVTKAAIYRRGCEIMREAMGPRRHLLDCGPGPVSVGLIDSMRIELDQPPVTWQQYFLHSASTAPAAAKRYYYHNRTWINDADHVVLSNLTVPQAQAAATIVSLSGGNMIAGDRMTDLDVPRLEILKKVFPSFGEAARPIDLFERDRPEIFALQVKKPFGEWLVLGIFNADEKAPAEKVIALDRLGLDAGKTYVAFDFWRQKFYGELRGQFTVRLEPASVVLLAIHERRGCAATDLHRPPRDPGRGGTGVSGMERGHDHAERRVARPRRHGAQRLSLPPAKASLGAGGPVPLLRLPGLHAQDDGREYPACAGALRQGRARALGSEHAQVLRAIARCAIEMGSTPPCPATEHMLEEFLGHDVADAPRRAAVARVILVILQIVAVVKGDLLASLDVATRDHPDAVVVLLRVAIGRATMVDQTRRVPCHIAIEVLLLA